MADENAIIEDALEEDVLEDIPENAPDDTDWKALALKNAGIAKRAQTKLAKATAKPKEEILVEKPEAKKTDVLDEIQLDYLDLKGITEDEDVSLIEKVVAKTGMTVRQALKDEYVIERLKALKEKREVKDATPSSTKRAGPTSNNLEQAIARFERDGTLPDDFKFRSEVVNAIVDRKNGNKPSWA